MYVKKREVFRVMLHEITNVKRHTGHAEEHWLIEDTIVHADGSKTEMSFENSVVDGLRVVLGALMKGEAGYNNDFYFCIGHGSDLWDVNGVPPVDRTDSSLTNEYYRVLYDPSDIVYLDNLGQETESVSRVLKFTKTIPAGVADGAIREFCISGGNATAELNSGIMLNRKNHAVVNKGSSDSWTRTITVTL